MSRNGVSEAYEMDYLDQYGYINEEYNQSEKEVKLPGLFDHENGKQVVQYGDELSYNLASHKTSTGLREPECTNPYLDQRDASYIYGDSYYSSDLDSKLPTHDCKPIAYDAFAPEELHANSWQLGQNDMQSIFCDYYFDEYENSIKTAQDEILYQCLWTVVLMEL